MKPSKYSEEMSQAVNAFMNRWWDIYRMVTAIYSLETTTEEQQDKMVRMIEKDTVMVDGKLCLYVSVQDFLMAYFKATQENEV